MPTYVYECKKCGVIEIFHSIMDEPWTKCPDCGTIGLVKLISSGGGIIISGRMPNQYNDIKKSKYWRDHNGDRHLVTPGDGHSQSPTVSRKQTRTPEEAKMIKKNHDAQRRKQRIQSSYNRFENKIKKK